MSTRELVLIHGAQGSAAVWSAVVAALAERDPSFRVQAIDLPGHGAGRAQRPLESIRTMADWLAEQLTPAEERLVAGHSMGSLVALELAARYPNQVQKLALIGSAYPMPVAPALLTQAGQDPAAAMALVAKWSHSAQGGQVLTTDGRPLRELTLALMQAEAAELLAIDLNACATYRDGEAAAAAVRCPTLFICGGADKMTATASALTFAKRFTTARCEILPEVGHALMAEAPQAVADALRGLMSS